MTASTVDSTSWVLVVVFLVLGSSVAIGLYGTEIVTGQWDWLESLMGLPILAGALLAGWQGMMRAWGSISVERDGDVGRIRQGAGWLMITRRFQWVDIWTAEEEVVANVKRIALKRHAGDIRFGGLLNEARRQYLIAVIREGLRGV